MTNFKTQKKPADGDFIVNMSYPENEWLYGYIMSFGEYAEVLEPTYIRDIIKTENCENDKQLFII